MAACTSSMPAGSAPGNGGPPPTTEQAAVALGVSILSSNAHGAPRLMQAFHPRTALANAAPEAIARDHVAALAPLWVQQAQPMPLVAVGTQPLRNGATVVRLAQQVDGVVVDQGELRVLMHRDGSLAAVSGTLLPAVARPTFTASPALALDRALDTQYGSQRARPAIADRGDDAGWRALDVAGDPRLRIIDARARRVLADDGGALVAAWEVEVSGDAAPDPLADPGIPVAASRRFVIADASGKILSDADLIQHDAFVYRTYSETTGNRRPLDGPLVDFSPHPTGIPDGFMPTCCVDSSLVVMEAFNQTLDKWLPDNATTASGNNAEAFSDLDGSGTFTPGDIRPEVRSGRILNFRYDPTLEALANNDQLKAGAVSTFFLNNWMHDWWYDSGFTEATGNAQVDNFGRGGLGADPIIVLAQAGALVGSRDNASMNTPADGRSPRMRIFVFTTSTVSALTTPSGTPHSEGFANGPKAFDVTGDVAIGDDGVAPSNDGCQPIGPAVAGKIVFLTFSGVCGSAATVNNAKAAGAIAVILADGMLDDPRGFAGSATANLPGLAIGKSDGDALTAAIAAGPVTVTLHSAPFGVERDGDLDSGVSGHEWAHYLHHRLAVCNAGQQCRGMSEGWGDFNGVLLQLRDGDNRDGTYAQGSWADNDGTPNNSYFSVRRFPYSTDFSKNPLRFRHIGDDVALPTTAPGRPNGGANSEVHNTGEIWASMLLDAFHVLIDEHGVPIARRRITDYSVAGLLLTPPEATFTEGRDAILAAASALDSDDMLLLAAAFAGRGAGSCAIAPTNAVRNNAGVIESGTLAARFAVGQPTLADDVISIDHDGILDPGESGLLRLTIANSGPVAAEAVTIAATTTNTGVKLGAPVHIPLLAPFSSADITIPVTLLASAPPGTPLTISLHITGEQTCTRDGVTVVFTGPTGIAVEPMDDMAMTSMDPPAASIAAPDEGRVVSTYQAPSVSLRTADAAVCIANDTP